MSARNWQNHLRLVAAVAAKDLTDGLKNKVILQAVLTVVLMVVLYRALPFLTASTPTPQVTVYGPADSTFAAALEESADLAVRTVTSRSRMEAFVTMGERNELGLVVPSDYSATAATHAPVVLEGYVAHWIADAEAERLASRVEAEVSRLLGQPVSINVQGNRVYPTMEAFGPHTWVAFSLVLALVLIGMSLTPQLVIEERQTHTLDALLVSPAGTAEVVAGKALAGLVYCLLGALLVLVVNHRMLIQWPIAVLAVASGSLLAVAVGLLLGTVIDHQAQIRIWVATTVTPLFILPVVVAFMGMDLPRSLIQMLRWFPSVCLARLLVRSMALPAPGAGTFVDATSVLAATAAILAVTIWRLRRADR